MGFIYRKLQQVQIFGLLRTKLTIPSNFSQKLTLFNDDIYKHEELVTYNFLLEKLL